MKYVSDVIIFECTASSDDFQENSELRERPDCTTNTEAVLKGKVIKEKKMY